MDITFSIPQAFGLASPPASNDDARRILDVCLARLNRPYRNVANLARYRIGDRSATWELPHVFYPGCSHEDNAHALRMLLECLTDLNTSYLDLGPKTKIPTLYQSGVRYARTTIWDSLPALYARGHGDCKSLTAAYVAQLRKQGIECAPTFRFKERSDGSGALDFHILVMTAKGFEDPSKVLGMGKDEVAPLMG